MYKKLKKPPQKVAYLSRNSVVSGIFNTAKYSRNGLKVEILSPELGL